jgi:hypothetical protein
MTRQITGIILSLVFYGFVAPAGADTVRIGSGVLDSTAPAGGTTGVQIDRVSRDGTASTWAAPKAYPGPIFTAGIHFDAYSVTFAPNATQTVFYEISLSSTSGGTAPVFSVAYLNSFNPANIATNYLGDPGSSPLPGPVSYQVVVPAAQTLVVVFSEVFANSLGNYSFSIDAFSDVNRDGFAVATPLPGALSLFASGSALLGFLGWRRKRKQTAVGAA